MENLTLEEVRYRRKNQSNIQSPNMCVTLAQKHLGVFFLMQYAHTCNNNTHGHTRPVWHMQRRKRGNSLSMSWTILDISWHIFYYTLPLFVTTSPQFSLPVLLTTRGCIWMKKDTHTHVQTDMQAEGRRRELFCNKKEEGTRVSLILLWCNIDNSMNTHTHGQTLSHTHRLMLFPSLIRAHMQNIADGLGTFSLQNKETCQPRDSEGSEGGKMEHAGLEPSFSLHIHTHAHRRVHSVTHLSLHPPLWHSRFAWDLLVKWDAWESGRVALESKSPPEFPSWRRLPNQFQEKAQFGWIRWYQVLLSNGIMALTSAIGQNSFTHKIKLHTPMQRLCKK